jgi:AcrR family transcriptional regulator
MGIIDRKEREREIRRSDIIEAAEKVFFTKGYDHATMDDVAKEAEFSKRTVYVYFNSKEQIYFEIMARGYRLLIHMLKNQLEKSCDAVETIRQIALTFYQFSLEQPDYFKAIMEYENGELDFESRIPDPSREECYALGEEILRYLTAAIEAGITESSIRSDLDVTKTALVLWASMIGVFHIAIKKESYLKTYHGTTPNELITATFQMIIGSIQTKNGGEQK